MYQYIDTHCHVIADDVERFPQNPLGGKQSAWAAARPVTAEQLLAQMDAHGIASAVLVQATTNYGYDNSYIMDCLARWPDRFAAVGTVDPTKPDAATWLRDAQVSGLAGVRLFTAGSTLAGHNDSYVREESRPFWEAAASLNIPVCLQLRLDSALDELHTVLESYPGATILLDHCGYPAIEQDASGTAAVLADLARFPNLYLKLTHRSLEPLSRLGDRAIEFLRPVIDAFTAGRIAWGSNCPAAEQPMGDLVVLVAGVLEPLTEDERRNILNGTARRLYPSLEGAPDAHS